MLNAHTHPNNTSGSTYALKSTIYNGFGQIFWSTNLQLFKAFSQQSTGFTCLNTYLQSARTSIKKFYILQLNWRYNTCIKNELNCTFQKVPIERRNKLQNTCFRRLIYQPSFTFVKIDSNNILFSSS